MRPLLFSLTAFALAACAPDEAPLVADVGAWATEAAAPPGTPWRGFRIRAQVVPGAILIGQLAWAEGVTPALPGNITAHYEWDLVSTTPLALTPCPTCAFAYDVQPVQRRDMLLLSQGRVSNPAGGAAPPLSFPGRRLFFSPDDGGIYWEQAPGVLEPMMRLQSWDPSGALEAWWITTP